MKGGVRLSKNLAGIEKSLCGIAYPVKTEVIKTSKDTYSFEMFDITDKGLVEYQPFTLTVCLNNTNNGIFYKIHKKDDLMGYGIISKELEDYERIANNDRLCIHAGITAKDNGLLRVRIGYMYGWTTHDEFRPGPGIMLFSDLVEKNYNDNTKFLARNRGKVWAFSRIADFFQQEGIKVVDLDKALTPLTDVYCNMQRARAHWFDDAYVLAKHVFDPKPEKKRKRDISLKDLVYSITKEENTSFVAGLEDTLRDDEGGVNWFYEENGRIMVDSSSKEDAERFIRDALV